MPNTAYIYMYHVCRTWYYCSETMITKPKKTLELHYPMFQFLLL